MNSVFFKFKTRDFEEIAALSIQVEDLLEESGTGFLTNLASIGCWQILGVDDITLAMFYLKFSEVITVISYRH